jgi:hypothetical protein
VHFFANRRARLSASLLLLGFYGLFIELFEVVIPDKTFVEIPARFLAPVDGAVIERQDIAIHGGVIDPERTAGIEFWSLFESYVIDPDQ